MRYVPNVLTILRIFLSIFIVIVVLYGQNYMSIGWVDFIACFLFFIASVTDFFDGYIARYFNVRSKFGEIFDPLADKMLILGAFIVLLVVDRANPWAVFIILSREFFISGLRAMVASSGVNLSANGMGKIKTFIQYFAVGALFANILPWAINQALLWLAVVVTVVSGYRYVREYIKSI